MATGQVTEVKEVTAEATGSATAKPRRADPLVLFRECLVSGKKVRYADDYLDLDGQRVHKMTKCGFRLSPAQPFLDIGSVWYMYHEIAGNRPYTKESTKKKQFSYIGIASRGGLEDYLSGRAETCPGLVQDVIEGRKRPREESIGLTPLAPRAKLPKASAEGSGDAASAPSRIKQKETKELSYADVTARARPVKDLDVLVRVPGRIVPNADLILKIAREEVSNWNKQVDPAKEKLQSGASKVPLFQELETYLEESKENLPIILVPCNKNATVNLLNVQALLQDGRYDKLDDEKVKFFESTRAESVEIARNMKGHQWTFQVRDSTKGFTKAQWLRVVAVITDGHDWQFKGWPFENIVDMFTSVRGVYFKAHAMPIETHVNEWPVSIQHLMSYQHQHRFAAVRDNFWTEIEKFMWTNRVKKFVNHTSLEGIRKEIKYVKPML
eukprot:TRINITY_DN83866_c0_g1_i1.p1 TRINITY_DN83866_c0_g1~~TRINITY_DN83866_c0_g1_i1.p1  ORF type:complete len:440 (-),score=73.08 TRINITY_DN83866_c0_g1_i1:84-1403(-)